MAQRLVTSFVNTNVPGAYPRQSVISKPVGFAASGNIVIIGEADGGAEFSTVDLKKNFFGPSQAAKVAQQYIRGPLVDAMNALTGPSADPEITGSANRIYIVKTNAGSQASAIVDTDYGTLKDQNYGLDGNKYNFKVTQSLAEVAPEVSGGTIPAFGAALNGAEFSLRQNGGAVVVITLSGTAGDHNNIANLIIELNSLLPVGVVASAGTAPDSFKLTMAVDAAANRKGWGKSLELIDSSSPDLAALGHVAGQTNSSQEPEIELSIARADINLSEVWDIDAEIALQVGYLGTTATMTINQSTKVLTTTVTGGAGANLSLNLANFATLADLSAFIAAQPGYSSAVPAASVQLAPSALDAVTAIGIGASVAGDMPGRVKRALFDFKTSVGQSRALSFTATASAGLPAVSATAYLAGGLKGATTAANVAAAIQKLSGLPVNIVVPLFSRDASADIADGLTDSGSTYTIDAIHALVKTHCLAYSTPKLKKHRSAVLSFWGTYAQAQQKAQQVAQYRCAMTMQRATQINSDGASQNFLPWMNAVIAAGMQAGGFYKSITNKLANIIEYEDPAGFDSGDPTDNETALDAGLMFLTQEDNDGPRWVSDQTTYGYDTNFVYNSFQAVYLSDSLTLDLASSFQKAFTGKNVADIDAGAARGFLHQKMAEYKRLKMIASSDDAPLGFKNEDVVVAPPELDIAVEVKLATAIYFIPIDVSFSQVIQAAA